MKSSRLERGIYGLCLGLILLCGFKARWSLVTRTIWLDEITHNYGDLLAKDVWETIHYASVVGQAPFDYLMRKYFWFPLFGHQELALRIPSVTYSMLTLLLA